MNGGQHDEPLGPDPACEVARGERSAEFADRVLVAVFAGPVAEHLLHFAAHCGFTPVLLEPDEPRAVEVRRQSGWRVETQVDPALFDEATDVVVTDHDRPELGDVLLDVLAQPVRWVGVMGALRHTAPHVAALAARAVPAAEVARVHRPVGLNIGSKAPAEIAVATLAGLIADRNGRPGGFDFS